IVASLPGGGQKVNRGGSQQRTRERRQEIREEIPSEAVEQPQRQSAGDHERQAGACRGRDGGGKPSRGYIELGPSLHPREEAGVEVVPVRRLRDEAVAVEYSRHE